MTTVLRRYEPESEEPERKGRRWTLWASGIIVAAVAICGVVYVMLPSGGDAAAPAYSGPAVVIQPQPAEAPVGPCNFPKLDSTNVVTIAPPDTTWTLAGSMAAPSSATYGPLHRENGIPACYARTPQGALLAATGWVTARQDPKTDKLALLNAMVAHSAGYDQMLANFQSLGSNAAEADVPPVSQIAGFRMLYFDVSHAEVEIVTRSTSGNAPGYMASVVYVLTWRSDDWKIAPVLDGNAPITQPVTTLGPPYVTFSGA